MTFNQVVRGSSPRCLIKIKIGVGLSFFYVKENELLRSTARAQKSRLRLPILVEIWERMSVDMRKHFGSASFYKRAFFIGVPVMLQQLIQTMVSLIDNFMVSGLGDVKMSGVNISGQILFMFMVLLNAICMAGGIFMTQYSGANDKEGMRQALCFKLIVAGCVILLYMFVCMVIPRPVLSLMVVGNHQAEAILDQGERYMFLMGLIGIPMVISTIVASSLREIGQVKQPLVISVLATCVNTFFNWVLIYGNLGAPRLEVQGAAYATIIARVLEMVLYILLLMKMKPPFMITFATLKHIDFGLFGKIFKKGSLVLFSEMLWVISETITTALYNGKGGADVVSGMASSFAIANLYFVAFGGIVTATSVIIGMTLGRGELDEARKQKNWMLSASVVFGLFMSVVGVLTVFLVPVVFKNLSLEAQTICKEMVLMMALFMPVWVYVNTQFAVAKAGGDTIMGAVVDGSVTIFLILPGIFIMAFFTPLGPVAMYGIMKLADLLKITIAHIWLKKERWVKNLAT